MDCILQNLRRSDKISHTHLKKVVLNIFLRELHYAYRRSISIR